MQLERGFIFWILQGIRDIHEDSLILFRLLDPRPDVIFIGYGDRTQLVDPSDIAGQAKRKKNMEIIARITIAMRQQVFKFL
jgi:hypothetical protein